MLEITSVDGGSDATKVAYNLGRVLGMVGTRSMVVDADVSGNYSDGNNERWGDRARAVDGFPDTFSRGRVGGGAGASGDEKRIRPRQAVARRIRVRAHCYSASALDLSPRLQ